MLTGFGPRIRTEGMGLTLSLLGTGSNPYSFRERLLKEHVSHGLHVCTGCSVLYFNTCPTFEFQIMHIIIIIMHTAHSGHCVYNSDGILRLHSGFRFEFIMYTLNTSS